MENKSELVERLRRLALIAGIVLGVISVFFSYDGFDQSITGGNLQYDGLTKVIGITLAVIITLLQFIFNTDYRNLNLTLKVVGAVSYGYSIWTNFLGVTHLFGFDQITAWTVAAFMDITPESLIAWSMKDALHGDFLGNLGKMVWGDRGGGGEQRGGGHGGGGHNGSKRRAYLEHQRDRGGFVPGHGGKNSRLARRPLTEAELDRKIQDLGYKTTK